MQNVYVWVCSQGISLTLTNLVRNPSTGGSSESGPRGRSVRESQRLEGRGRESPGLSSRVSVLLDMQLIKAMYRRVYFGFAHRFVCFTGVRRFSSVDVKLVKCLV